MEKRACILVDTQSHEGGLIRRQFNMFLFKQPDKNSCSGTYLLNNLKITMHITGSVRMVVIEMDLKAGIIKTFLQPVKAPSLAGVNYD